MSARGLAVPPGRAGRLWLQRRLLVAERGADLLDRKLRVLRRTLGTLRAAADEAAADWQRCHTEAETRLLRASLLGGRRAVRLAADGRLAEVTVRYDAVMGVRYPSGSTCVMPGPGTWDGPVLADARRAHRAALAAAVRLAAAAEAVRLVTAGQLTTQHRLRALRDRWIPRLEQALAEVTLAIEEQEIADAARLSRFRGQAAPQGPANARLLHAVEITTCCRTLVPDLLPRAGRQSDHDSHHQPVPGGQHATGRSPGAPHGT